MPGMERPEQLDLPQYEEVWTGDYIFENEWQSFRTKKDRKLELTSVFHECLPGRRKVAVKVVDIFGNDTMTIVEVTVGGGGSGEDHSSGQGNHDTDAGSGGLHQPDGHCPVQGKRPDRRPDPGLGPQPQHHRVPGDLGEAEQPRF